MNRNDDLLNQALMTEQAGCRKDDTQCFGKCEKPTYEQLEEKIAVLSVQLELCTAAERAWEVTMMRTCGEDGPSCVAGKFNQLAARLKQSQIDAECYKRGMDASNKLLADVVAENAALKLKSREVLKESAYVYSHYKHGRALGW